MEGKIQMQFSKISKYKSDIICILIIAVLSIFFLHNIIGTQKLMNNGHYLHEQTLFSYNYKEALKYKTLPLWTHYWYSGQPFYGDPQVFFLNLTLIFILLFKNIFLAINLSTLTYFFLSGCGAYLLLKYITKNSFAGLISAIVYMFNGLIYDFIKLGNPSILEPYSLIPFIFLFVLKAAKSVNYIRYSIFAGILCAFQIFSGGMIIFLYTITLIGFFLAYNLIGPQFISNLKRSFIIGLVIVIICAGLSAIKLLPNIDFIENTNRAAKLSFREYIGEDKFVLKDFFKIIVINGESQSLVVNIGVVSFFLVLVSITQFRKRLVFFSLTIMVFSIMLASGGYLAYLFYKIPAFSQTRHIARILFLFVVGATILTGYGFVHFSNLVKSKFKSNKLYFLIAIIIIVVMLAELLFMKEMPTGFNVLEQLEKNQLANYLKKEVEKEKFRITTFDVKDLISFYGSSYYAQYGLETISGGGGIWINDYIQFLAIANNYNPSKLYGILNVKYVTSTKKVDIPGFKLLQKFEECEPCNEIGWTYWIDGPYLYVNEEFLPRYYTVDNSILIVGDKVESTNLMYSLLLNDNFNPETTVIIQGKQNINQYELEVLKQFDIIILTKNSVDSSSIPLLKEYSKLGGKILPDVTENKFAISNEELNSLLSSLKGNLTKADIKYFSPNKIIVLPQKPGFLVLSEKFYMFPDWKASVGDGYIDILQANGIISSVYLKEKDEVIFTYRMKSFFAGLIITVISAIIIFIYLLFSYSSSYAKQNKSKIL